MSSLEETMTAMLGIDFQSATVYLDNGVWTLVTGFGNETMPEVPDPADLLAAQTAAEVRVLTHGKRVISRWLFSGNNENGAQAIYA